MSVPLEGGEPKDDVRDGPDAPRATALVRLVEGIPSGVRSKLLVGLFSGVVLLMITGTLGLRAIADSNERAEPLRALQHRGAAYRALQTAVEESRFLIAFRPGAPALLTHFG